MGRGMRVGAGVLGAGAEGARVLGAGAGEVGGGGGGGGGGGEIITSRGFTWPAHVLPWAVGVRVRVAVSSCVYIFSAILDEFRLLGIEDDRHHFRQRAVC